MASGSQNTDCPRPEFFSALQALNSRANSFEFVRSQSTFGREFWFYTRLVPFVYEDDTHLLVLLSDILHTAGPLRVLPSQRSATPARAQRSSSSNSLYRSGSLIMASYRNLISGATRRSAADRVDGRIGAAAGVGRAPPRRELRARSHYEGVWSSPSKWKSCPLRIL